MTDVVMPGINGRELRRRAQRVRPGIKILYMTGYSRNAVVHQGRLDEGVELLEKPIFQAKLALRYGNVNRMEPKSSTKLTHGTFEDRNRLKNAGRLVELALLWVG